MNGLEKHAHQMRAKVFQHMLRTRGWKYRSFLRYLRFFKYISFTWNRGEFLECYYTLMRYFDDIVDGDVSLPAGYTNSADYILDKIKFSKDPVDPVDEADFLMLHCFNIAGKFGESFHEETADILGSLLFDARRKGKLIIFPEKELKQHFHLLDIRGTIKATLKIFKEEPEKYLFLEPLGTASRYQFDLEDFYDDIKAGYVNISKEDCDLFGIDHDELHDLNSGSIKAWFYHHATMGMELLNKHHEVLPQGRFSLLARGTFPLVYEMPAKKVFEKVITENRVVTQRKIAYEFNN